MKLSRRNAVIAGAAALALGAGGYIMSQDKTHPRARLNPKTGKRYNVLFVFSDQERDWSLYPDGFIDKHTPARAWLRDNGTRFTRFNTPSPICSTARGMVYSGVHSQNNGVWDNVPILYASPLSRDVPTLGTMFQDAGYITGYAGKWHLSRMSESPDEAEAQEINATIKSYGFMETDNRQEVDGPITGWKYDERTVAQSLGFVKRRATDEAPWFLAVNLLNPHDIMYYTANDAMTASRVSEFPDKSARPPIEDPLYKEDLGYELTQNYGPTTFGTRPNAVVEYGKAFSESMGHMPYDDLAAGREMQNYYWNCTRDSDRHLKTLLDGLRASGALEDTIIVFTSDHGELLGTHGLRGKGTGAYRESSHVPALIVHPAGNKGGTNDAILGHTDWAPTLLALAGVNPDDLFAQLPMLVGRDFSSLVFDPAAIWSRGQDGMLLHWTSIAFAEHRNVRRFSEALKINGPKRMLEIKSMLDEGLKNRSQMRGIYDGRWKFSRYCSPLDMSQPGSFDALMSSHDIELYDTQSDPGEVQNLATQAPAMRGEIERLNASLNRLIAKEIGKDDCGFLPPFVKI
jgi:arylsulfatase A-like enzyme